MNQYLPYTDANFSFGFYDPNVEAAFAVQADTLAPGIVSYAQQIATSAESIIDAIARAMATVNMAQAQRDFLSLQLDRARQGLAPLDVSQYTPVQQADGRVVYAPKAPDAVSPFALLALGAGAVMLLRK